VGAMAEAVHQFGKRGAGNSGPRSTRAAQVVKVQTGHASLLARTGPPRPELGPTQRVPLGAGEEQSIGLGAHVVDQVVFEDGDELDRDVDRPAAVGLRGLEDCLASAQLDQLLDDMDLAVEQVDPRPDVIAAWRGAHPGHRTVYDRGNLVTRKGRPPRRSSVPATSG